MSPVPTAHCDLPSEWDWIEKSTRFRAIKERCEKTESGCWLVPAYGHTSGYAFLRATVGRRRLQWLAHRFVWMLVKGPIPNGMYVCHTCDVRNCVNPAHLWLGTCEENQQDRVRKGRHAGNKRIRA